jgi:hypothetical protein
MPIVPLHPTVLVAIKITSIGVISGALGLVLWQLYALANQEALPPALDIIVWIGSAALLVHAAEGIVAAAIATRRGGSAIASGIYTFFTGTVGLAEMLNLTRER